ncbi:MAG: T9SS type A sorting domain-containing protein [Chitinophagales bacterium]|nr:T9SS type A sorting domain-containing protein [Chitinophagales bacterium]
MRSKPFTLESYTLIAVAILGADKLHAQLITVDYDPDLRLMNWTVQTVEDSITIDIDGNGINDLVFNYYLEYYQSNIELEINDCVISIGVEENYSWSAYNIEFLDFGEQVGASHIWANEGNGIFTVSTFFSSFNSNWDINYRKEPFVDKYLPLKLKFGDDIYYGFVRLSIKTFGSHFFTGAYSATGSPLTIFSVSYNAIPNEPVICDENVLTESVTINEVRFYDDLDAQSFNDFTLEFYGSVPDYSEIRVYLIPSAADVINFSVNEAMALDASRYHSIPAAEVLSPNIIHLPESLLDINGNIFNPDIYYSAFYMKIPIVGEDITLSLSTPLNILKPKAQHCDMSVDDISFNYLHQDEYFQVSFSADEEEYDISSYGIGLANEHTIEILLENHDYAYVDTSGLIQIPKTGASSYLVNLIGLDKDIWGNPLIVGAKYTPVIYGLGDGYFRDLLCYDQSGSFITYPLKDIKQTQIYYTDDLLTINIPIEMVGNSKVELVSISGQKIMSIDLIQENTTIEISLFPEGIYFASIRQNNEIKELQKINIY